MSDPFANDPFAADEAEVPEQSTGSPWEDTAPATNNTQEKIIVQNANESKVVVTLKGGAGYDAPWIVIHAEDIEDATNQIGDDLKSLMGRVKSAASYFSGGGQAAPQQDGGKPRTQGKPAGATQAPNGEVKHCAHGEMKFNSGVKNGKTWSGFFCPLPKDRKDEQCPPAWPKR